MQEEEVIGKIMESEFNLDEKAQLVLIACDTIKATFFTYSIVESNFGKSEFRISLAKQNISKIKIAISRAINGIGLSHCFEDEHIINGHQWIVQVCIAKEAEVARYMQHALHLQDHEIIGRLHGFPETAIEAFVQKSPSANINLPFLEFAMSLEHFEEELTLWKKWIYVIRDKCPMLFSALEDQLKETILFPINVITD